MMRFARFGIVLALACASCLAALAIVPIAAGATVRLSSSPDRQVWVTDGSV